MLIPPDGRLSTLLSHTPEATDGPLRRDCGHFVAAHELELSAGSGQARAWQNIGSGRLSAHQSSLCAGHGTTLPFREIDI